MVINQLETDDYKTCKTMEHCLFDLDEDDMYNLLINNFKRHYLTNRAPYGLHFHSTWFRNERYLTAFQVRTHLQEVRY